MQQHHTRPATAHAPHPRTLSGCSRPAASRSAVDLPVPLLPMMPTASPRRILKLAPHRMCLLQGRGCERMCVMGRGGRDACAERVSLGGVMGS